MTRFTAAKLVLALAGIGLFLWASGRDHELVRRVAIGLVVAAFLMRFVERLFRRPPPPPDGQDPLM